MAGQTPGSAEGGLSQSYVTGLTETSLTDLEGVGKVRYENKRWYKWVKYDDGAGNLDIVAGDFLMYLASTGYGLSTVVADTDDADATTPFGAGVAVAAVTVTATFMWIQFKGLVTLSLDPSGTPGDSNALVPGADKLMAIATSSDVEHICGHTVNDASKIVYLDCPW